MKLYLSRLSLNRSAPTSALMPLLDPKEPSTAADAHHRLIWSLFSDRTDRKRDFLWRYSGRGHFLTLSQRPPQANDLFNTPETRVFAPQLTAGDRLQFLLRANATRDRAAVSRLGKKARRGRSRRVDVVMDLLRSVSRGQERADIRDPVAQRAADAWMKRQGEAKGFAPGVTVLDGYSTIGFGRRGRRGGRIGILDLRGVVEVTDPGRFLAALTSGFGRAKAWGCGLMLIRRAP